MNNVFYLTKQFVSVIYFKNRSNNRNKHSLNMLKSLEMLRIPVRFMFYEYIYLGLHDSADFLSFERQFFFNIFETLIINHFYSSFYQQSFCSSSVFNIYGQKRLSSKTVKQYFWTPARKQ